jgi:hypothetical protein
LGAGAALSREPRHHLPLPLSLRWLTFCKHPSGVWLPAMMARVVDVDGETIGVHRTYLRHDGTGKAAIDPVRAALRCYRFEEPGPAIGREAG